jgi:ribosomal protein S18 acetylase RimI-like enzyme
MNNVTFLTGNEDLIDRTEFLWEDLNKHHLTLSPHFKEYYSTLTFADRKQAILQKALGGEIRVDIAINDSGKPVAYCTSSMDRWSTGEIESIFVSPHFRRQGIGTALMKKALQWLNSKGAKKKIVSVATGNEQAYVFYKQFGFYPRRTLLEQKSG